MKPRGMTDVERRVAEGWKAFGFPIRMVRLRSRLMETAYHEAGHSAARLFTGLEAGHVVGLSVIPTVENQGFERVVGACAEHWFSSAPWPVMRGVGRCALLNLLAGRGAQARVTAPEERADTLDEDALWEEGEIEGTDLFRALRIAKIMARPGMPDYRVLTLAAKWTGEMLALPDVWRTVETLASLLLIRGTIDRDEIMTACEGIRDMALWLPKWKRRLFLSKDEHRSAEKEARKLPE